MEHFLYSLKLDLREGGGAGVGLKELHSHVRDSTDRKQLNTYKTKQPNTKWIKKYMYHIIQYDTKDLKFDNGNHAAYAAYANS